MKYCKPPITFDQQADLLLARGLQADRTQLIRRLQATNYYRLSTYLYPFRARDVAGKPTDNFAPSTDFNLVWRRYGFDHRLRMLLLDAIEGIEVHARTQLAYCFAHLYGPFAYQEERNFPNFDPAKQDFQKWNEKAIGQTNRGREPKSAEEPVAHFFRKYGDTHQMLPIWVFIELMDFGSTLSFFRGVSDPIRKQVASTVRQPDAVVLSWLLALNTVRNRCAHHSRLWDWKLGTPVLIPQEKKFPDWHAPAFPNDRVGVILTICRYWQNNISTADHWTQRLFALFDEFPEIPTAPMGLPSNWREHPLWKS